MESTSSPPPPWARTFGVLALAALAAMAVWFAVRARTPFPFVTADVALVHLACAVPLAALLGGAVRRRATPGAAVALAVVALAAGWLLLVDDDRGTAAVPTGIAMLWRGAAGLCLAFAAVWSIDLAAGTTARTAPGLGAGLLWTVVMLVAPATYTAARVQRDLERLDGLVEQSRFGEAAPLARRVLALDGGAELRGEPLSEMTPRLDAVVEQLESRVAAPLRRGASASQRLDRATELAMLGRAREALEVSADIHDPALAADVANLRGTIHEAVEDWDEGLAAFEDAKAHLAEQPPSPERHAALVRAVTGIAYCQRKRSAYDGAEAAYQELLALAPSADSHFLLAQFYEDAQQTSKAEVHARHAMQLDPQRYGRRGKELIRKLTLFHFGCWSVQPGR